MDIFFLKLICDLMKMSHPQTGCLARACDHMSVTILYRNPQRPDEAGRIRAPDDGYAAALKEQLEKRGFQVVEIIPAVDTKPTFSSNRQPAPSPQRGGGRTIRLPGLPEPA